MTTKTHTSPELASPKKTRRRWYMFLLQYSLRSLLIVMTLAAIGCWWFLQPKWGERQIANGKLKLWRQFRTLKVDEVSSSTPPLAINQFVAGDELTPGVIAHGVWRLRDHNDDLLATGRYEEDQPQGKWIIYHVNGLKAAEGEAFQGVKTGLWRTWDEYGNRISEVMYVVGPQAYKPPVERPLHWGGSIPVVGFCFVGGGSAEPEFRQSGFFAASRHGPARVWYPSGQLRTDGHYKDDLRDGPWASYAEDGRVIEQGSYLAGKRDGQWITFNASAGKSQTNQYLSGRTKDEHDRLLARLESELIGKDLRRQIAAAAQLEELGPAATPVLVKSLNHPSDEVILLALRALVRQDAISKAPLARVQSLSAHADTRIAARALLALYVSRPDRRERLFPPLLSAVERLASEDAKVEVLHRICQVDAERLPLAFAPLVRILAKQYADYESGYDHGSEMDSLLSLKADLPLLLETAFDSRDPDIQVYVLAVLERWIEHGRRPSITGAEMRWEIPASAQPLVNRGKQSADPGVRWQAEDVGIDRSYGSHFGPGFF